MLRCVLALGGCSVWHNFSFDCNKGSEILNLMDHPVQRHDLCRTAQKQSKRPLVSARDRDKDISLVTCGCWVGGGAGHILQQEWCIVAAAAADPLCLTLIFFLSWDLSIWGKGIRSNIWAQPWLNRVELDLEVLLYCLAYHLFMPISYQPRYNRDENRTWASII